VGDHTNLSRLKAIATEAAEQTERLDVPEILAPQKLETLVEQDGHGVIFYGEENSTHPDFAPVPSMLKALETAVAGTIAALIGPEGGFDDHERHVLQGHRACVAVNLGPRILRADTAALCALTLIQATKGDWKNEM
jgi:16S rRNA (uracil1498-N3)-methyltransferase